MSANTPEIQHQMAHWGADRGPEIVAAAVILMVATTLFVGLRLWAQKMIKARFDVDDYLIMVALLLALGLCATTIICVHFGMGKHILRAVETDPQPPYRMVNLFKAIWVEGFLWALEIPLVKVAILIFYRRVFTGNQRWFRWAFWIMIAYCVAWAIATFVIVMVQCVPIPYFWNRAYAFYKLEPPGTGTCLETTPSQVPVAFLNCIGDLVLILLPFPVLLRLQMNIRRKIELSIIFGLGAFVLVASIVRLRFIWADENTQDPSWDDAETLVWTPAECCVGVICACIPCLAPLRRFLPGGSRYHLTHKGATTTKSWGNTKGDLSTTASRKWPGLKTLTSTAGNNATHPVKGELYDSSSSGELAVDGWGAKMGRLDAEANQRMVDEEKGMPSTAPPDRQGSTSKSSQQEKRESGGFDGGPIYYAPNWKGVVVNKGFAGPLSSNSPTDIPKNAIKISKEMESVQETRRKSEQK